MELLHAAGLEKRVGHRLILDDVSISVSAGSCVALLGPNGAGKSTLIKVLAGLSHPTAGEIRLAGKNPTDDPSARAMLGVALHESMLYGDLTAEENLHFYGRLFGIQEAAERAADLLRFFGLDLFAGEQVRNFSRGMTQRLSLARALMHSPKVLLLDEVFAGLDLAGVALAEQAVADAISAGCAVILVTHELPIAQRLASRVAYLDRGCIALDTAASDTVWEETAQRLTGGGSRL